MAFLTLASIRPPTTKSLVFGCIPRENTERHIRFDEREDLTLKSNVKMLAEIRVGDLVYVDWNDKYEIESIGLAVGTGLKENTRRNWFTFF